MRREQSKFYEILKKKFSVELGIDNSDIEITPIREFILINDNLAKKSYKINWTKELKELTPVTNVVLKIKDAESRKKYKSKSK